VSELHVLRGSVLRRAVFGIFLSNDVPLTAGEVVAELHAHGATTSPLLTKGPLRTIGDLLAHQARVGRLERVGRGRYRLVAQFSRTTRWRYRHWPRSLPVPSPALSEKAATG